MDGELDVRTARFNTDLANDRQTGVAHPLIFLVAERLGRRDGDRVARVNAHRIEVLDRADDHDIVIHVAHHLHLVLFPADDRLFDQHLGDRRLVEPAADQRIEFLAVVSDGRTAAAQRETGSYDARQANHGEHLAGILDVMHGRPATHLEPNLLHGPLELLALLGLGDHVRAGPDHFDVVLRQHAVASQVHGQIESRLAAERRQERIGAFPLDDLLDNLPRERLDVRPVGGGRVGHDRRRVRIDQDDFVTFLAQGLAGLRARIVELASLSDDDGTRADEQDFSDVGTAGHASRFLREAGAQRRRERVAVRRSPSLANRLKFHEVSTRSHPEKGVTRKKASDTVPSYGWNTTFPSFRSMR